MRYDCFVYKYEGVPHRRTQPQLQYVRFIHIGQNGAKKIDIISLYTLCTLMTHCYFLAQIGTKLVVVHNRRVSRLAFFYFWTTSINAHKEHITKHEQTLF